MGRHIVHGCARQGKHTPEYNSWRSMMRRCNYIKDPSYKDYGARGITVCERWFRFENFLADMGERPSLQYSLERKDNNIGYDPDNCVWADKSTQNRNMRSNIHITYNGKTMIVRDWADCLGINYKTLASRLNKWPLERAMNEPVRKSRTGGI